MNNAVRFAWLFTRLVLFNANIEIIMSFINYVATLLYKLPASLVCWFTSSWNVWKVQQWIKVAYLPALIDHVDGEFRQI